MINNTTAGPSPGPCPGPGPCPAPGPAGPAPAPVLTGAKGSLRLSPGEPLVWHYLSNNTGTLQKCRTIYRILVSL